MTTFPGVITIDLDAIANNVTVLRDRVDGPDVMAVVKADAYGHGLVPCAKAALRGGATWLGVAQLSEAHQVRAAGITAPILTWLFQPGDDLNAALTADLDLSIASVAQLTLVIAAAAQVDRVARVHLKIDTGLGRNGCTKTAWATLLTAVAKAVAAGQVQVVGIWSHMAFADQPNHPSVQAQREAFTAAVADAKTHGIEPEHTHLANSAATLTDPAAHFSLVRPGLAVYGLSPVPEVASAKDFGLTPAMSLHVPLALVKNVPADYGVSYGLTYHTAAPSRLALVPMGYADGIPRHASGTGPVQLAGRRYTVAGRVCMDQFMLDLGPDSDHIQAGTDVELFGAGTGGGPTAQDWAEAADTISYEIVTRMGTRVPRHYRSSVPQEYDV